MSAVPQKEPDNKRRPKSAKLKAAEVLLRRQMGARLRDARKEAGHKHAKSFAALVDIEEGKYRKYERGEADIPHTVIVAIAQQHISIHYIFIGVGPKTVPEALRPTG